MHGMKQKLQRYIKSEVAVDSQASTAIGMTQPSVTITYPAVVTTAPSSGTILNGLPDVKAGKRHSRADQDRLQAMHDHSVALGADCNGGMSMGSKKPAKAAKAADVEGEEASDQAENLGLPLDSLVSAVQEAFWDLRTAMRKAQKPPLVADGDWYDWDDDLCPSCLAVYDGYAIARVALATYKVPYTVENEGIALADQSQWEQVTQEWVTKMLPASVMKAFALKRELGAVKMLGKNRLGFYLVAWGDEKRRDLTGEFFDRSQTEGLKAIFDHIGKIPGLYHHAMDGSVKYTPIGTIDVLEEDDLGLWAEMQLDMANQYSAEVQKLTQRKALGASSGTLPGARKVAPNGLIKAWPIIEGSLTPTPAETRLRELGVAELKAIYTDLGLDLPDELVEHTDKDGEKPCLEATDFDLEAERLGLLALELESYTG